jgi:aminopeptidase N
MGARDLKEKVLSYLLTIKSHSTYEALADKQYLTATNMTDKFNALKHLLHNDWSKAQVALSKFYQEFKNDKLVMQKWMSVQASNPSDAAYETVLKLEHDEVYDKTIPNFVRALFSTFGMNKVQFHHVSGRGYKLIAEKILAYDSMNPQVASRLASLFKDFKKLDAHRLNLMKVELEKIVAHPNLSKNVYEIISKTLND